MSREVEYRAQAAYVAELEKEYWTSPQDERAWRAAEIEGERDKLEELSVPAYSLYAYLVSDEN